MRREPIICLVCFGCWLVVADLSRALAHHGPTQAIEALSERIEHGERSAELFARRGDEYRALSELKHAAADYEAALQLDDAWMPAYLGLAHVHLAHGRCREAEATASRGVELAGNADGAAAFHALLARTHEQDGRWDDALQSWDRALASSRPEVDWFLGKVQLLWQLDEVAAAEELLQSAMRRNPSEVLKRAWYESLIRSGQLAAAEAQIESGLAQARWKSTWLLLRARLHTARGDRDAACEDGLAALLEIELRLRPDAPNPFLAADKARALALLGRHDEARQQAEVARSLGVPDWKLAEFPVASNERGD